MLNLHESEAPPAIQRMTSGFQWWYGDRHFVLLTSCDPFWQGKRSSAGTQVAASLSLIESACPLLKRSHLPSKRRSEDPVTDSPCVPVILQCIRNRTKFSLRDSGSRPVQYDSIYEFVNSLSVSM